MVSEVLLTCSRCAEKHSVCTYDSINIAETPELKAKVLDGSLFVWECPHCGTLNLIRSNTLYHDPSERLMIWVTGGSAELEAKIAEAYSKVEELSGYTSRFVSEVGDLIEKVKIFDAGLDDVIMEMCKYVTRMEICQKDKANEQALMEAPFKFLRLDGADNEITLAYPLNGQMQMVAVGFNIYEDCRGIIKRNPAAANSAAGFCRIDSSWLKQFFR